MTKEANKTPKILLSNDDGVNAPGLAALEQKMRLAGRVLVCAPSAEQSAKGHSISVDKGLKLAEHRRGGEVWAYSLDGTPADCVKFAITHLLGGRKPDLVVSGINRGRNTGINILYSGTVAAAAEGAFYGAPGISVSLDAARDAPEFHFETAAVYAERLGRSVLREGLPEGVVLNVNVPNSPLDRIRGVVISRMSRSMFVDEFSRENVKGGIAVVRNVGDRMVFDMANQDNDDRVLNEEKVSITPLHFDLTHHHFREELQRWVEQLRLPDISHEIEDLSHDLGAEVVD